MMETQSFSARRSAASNLPQFQLPPPDHLSGHPMHSKYPAYAPTSTTQSVPTISAIPTPPVGLPSDGLSPLASSVNSSSGSSAGGAPSSYGPMGFWPTPQNPTYNNYSSGPPMPSPFAQQQHQSQNYAGRPTYSPMNNFPPRNTQSPTTGEGLPAPPYDLNLPPFPTSMGSSGGQQQNLPQLAPQHLHQQHQHQQNINIGQHPASQAPQQSPLHAPDTYGGRPPPTPTYYNNTPSSTPQQSSFPAYVQQSPTQSPITTGPSRISPISAQSHSSMSAPQQVYHRPFGSYSLPAMAGPIMSNAHSPGNQMTLVGGMNMYPQHHQMGAPMYGHPSQQAPPNDRPFKCDQCPQSFNRNHDLKRHKRIHLAVKPFPCNHCDKSFSRKDALKRHILVKGCGTKNSGNIQNVSGGSQSPVDRSEIMSDSADDTSPLLMKKEL